MSNPSPFSRLARRLILILLLLVQTGGAVAQTRTLDGPRAAGTVGERYDGYAMVRDPASTASLGPLVNQINSERRKLYTDRAAADHHPPIRLGEFMRPKFLNPHRPEPGSSRNRANGFKKDNSGT